jgi:pimeloyl-ACP methyl ester carboxylesterase
MPVLERMRGPAIAMDLPGFGRSERPGPERFDSTMRSYGDFVEAFLERMGISEHSLVVHDWGGVGLLPAQRHPERIRRLAVINAVPLLPGYRWHRTARLWRTPVLGELSNRLWSRRLADFSLRESRGDRSRHDPAFVDLIWDHLDRGTLDAVLRLYRSAPSDELEAAGSRLGAIEAPALVIWGQSDRYLPARFGRAYAERLPNSELVELPGVGHWPWRDDPAVIERLVAFLEP